MVEGGGTIRPHAGLEKQEYMHVNFIFSNNNNIKRVKKQNWVIIELVMCQIEQV
jgi:hypothetical protein